MKPHWALQAVAPILAFALAALAQEITVDYTWSSLCAQNDMEMQRLYEENLDQDLYYWKLTLAGRKLNRADLMNMTDRYGGIFARNPAGPTQWTSSQHNMVLIKDNKWYTPFRPFEWDISYQDCINNVAFCSSRLAYGQWAFERWTTELGLKFPDTLFFYDVGDSGDFPGVPGSPPMPAPVFTYFKQRPEMGYPRQRYNDAGAILMPSLYTDLERDTTHASGLLHTFKFYHYPWDQKIKKMLFRGTGYCNAGHENRAVHCPREHLTNASLFNGHGDILDVKIHEWTYHESPQPTLPVYDQKSLKEHARYKYVLALDGVSASNRFAKLLFLNSVVLKEASPVIGHFYRSVLPYEHYLPVMERHPLDFREVFTVYEEQMLDHELRRIVDNAQRFAAKYLCDRALALYFRKSLEEYTALFSDMQGRPLTRSTREVRCRSA